MAWRRRSWRAPARLCVVVLALSGGHWAQGLVAQQPPSTARAGLESIQIRPNVHVIFGAGGNVTVHVGEDGLIVVDSGSTDMAGSLLDAIKAISPRPIRMVVNTSADLDYVGGNAVVGGAGVGLSPDPFGDGNHATVLAHENVLRRLSALGANGNESPYPTKMLPNDTFTSRYRSMYVNDDAVQVIRQTGAHSDSDVMVLFRRADVIATGDVLDLRQFPVIDPAKGGSIQGEIEALNRLLSEFVVAEHAARLEVGRHTRGAGAWLRVRLRRGGRVPRHGHRDQGHRSGSDRQGADAAAGEGRQSHEGLSRPVRQGFGIVDDGHVCRGRVQRAEREEMTAAPPEPLAPALRIDAQEVRAC